MSITGMSTYSKELARFLKVQRRKKPVDDRRSDLSSEKLESRFMKVRPNKYVAMDKVTISRIASRPSSKGEEQIFF